MSDAQLVWKDYGADIAIGESGDLVIDDGLATAVIISLFTDARAPLDAELPQAETSRRGWWNDTEIETAGSLLWLVQREKTTDETAARFREYCEQALAWIVNLNIAESVEVVPLLVRPSGLQLTITIKRGKATGYAYLWENMQAGDTLVISGTSIKLQFI